MNRVSKSSPADDEQFDSSAAVWVLSDVNTGQIVSVRGAGALAGYALEIEPGIDLTQPIAEQVLGKPRKRG